MQFRLPRIRWALLSAALLTPLVFPALADPPAIPTLRAETRVVQIEVLVKDSRGNPVANLSKDDFTVTDEGKPRKIDIFSPTAGKPGGSGSDVTPNASSMPPSPALPPKTFSNRNAGPPADTGHSTVIVLDQVNAFLEDAAYARGQVMSLMKKLPPDERIALYVIARKEGLVILQDYTTDRALLLKNLTVWTPRGLLPSTPPPPTSAIRDGEKAGPGAGTAAAVAAFSSGGDQPLPPGLAPGRLGSEEKLTAWYGNSAEARLSLQALAEHLALLPGRKSVYWVTQGFPSWVMKEKRMGSPPPMEKPAWDKTIAELNEADIAVNTVEARGLLRGGNPNGGTLDTMLEIAGRTGGKAYYNRSDLDAAIEEGIEASRVAYTLGFYLPDTERDDRLHALNVKAGRPGLQLFYRQGYYAGSGDMPGSSNKAGGGELESALLNQVDATGVGITARIDAVAGTPQGTATIHLNLDPATLSLTERGSGWAGKVEEMFVELGASGETLAKVSDVKEFEIPGATRAQYDAQGLTWPMSIPLAEGAARITIVVRDAKTGHVGSLTVPF